MSTIKFKLFRGRGDDVCIVAARITHFYPIDDNGRRGVATCIVLDSGKEVTVDEYFGEVRKSIDKHLFAEGSNHGSS